MANSDKNIRITTSKNKITYPNIVFTGSAAGSSVITLEVLDDNTLSFTSNEGQVFSIDSNLSTGTIWAVSDISGIPLLSASAGGTVGLGVYGGLVAIGQTNPIYKLDLKGSFGLASSNDSLYNFIFSNSAASGSNSLQIRSANSLLLYNSGNTFYTGFKSNAATNITYTLPTTDGSSGQFLQTNGSAVLTWATATGSGGTGSTTGVGQGGQYEMAYYPGTGLSVIGSNTFTNNTVTGVVSITHATVATDSSTGAFKVTGGVGIGGSLYVGGIGASITGVTFANSTITRGTWNGTAISTTYGGTGQNLGSSSGVLTISSGTVSASTTSSAILSAITDETGSGVLVFNTQPSFGTGVTTGSATFAVFNTNATAINAFGAATTISIGAATGKATFNSTDNSISSTTGGLVVSGGAGFAKSISIAGYLQLLNGANVTAFVSSGTGNTVYTLPATSPATGTSVLQSTSAGVLSWVPMVASSSGAGSGTVAVPGAQYQIAAYYSGTGASVSGSATFTNSTAASQVAITHNTASTSTNSGALVVSGGLGLAGNAFIGGTISVPSTSTSNISNILFTNGVINSGTWAATAITAHYGGTGLQTPFVVGDILYATSTTAWGRLAASSTVGQVLTSNGAGNLPTYQAVPPAAASSVAVTPTVVNASFFIPVVNTASGAAVGLSTVSTLVINPSNNIVTLSGLAVTAVTQTTNATSGALIVTNGAAVGQTLSVGGSLNIFNSANYTGFRFSGSASTTYTLPLRTPTGTGTSYLSSSVDGVMAWVAAPTSGGSGSVNSGTATYAAFYASTTNAVSENANLQFTGTGVSVGGNLSSSSTLTGSLIVRGGLGITGNAFIGSTVTIQDTTVSSSTTTGALVVAGGIGVGGKVFADVLQSGGNTAVGGNLTVAGTVDLGNAIADSISFLGRVDTDIDPISDNTYDLGVPGLAYRNASFGSSIYFTNTTNTNILAFTAGATGTTLTYVLPIDTPTTGQILAASVISGGRVTLSWEDDQTGAPAGGITTLNTLTTATQSFATGTAGNDFAISSATSTHTFNLPDAGSSARGVVSTGTQTLAGAKTFSSALSVTDATVSTSSSTGALKVTGGVGIGGSLYAGGISNFSSNTASISSGTGALVVTNGVGIGGSLNVASASSISGVILNTNYISAAGGTFTTILQAATIRALSGNTISFQTIDGTNAAQINNARVAVLYGTISTSSGTGALVVSGGAGIGGSLYVASASQFESSVASIGVGSGAVVVTGGVGIGGSINVGGASRFSSSTTATSVGTGALTVTGGAGIAGSLYVGEASRFTSATVSLGSGTGALTVTGGVGIGGSLYVANTSRFESSAISSSVGTGALTVTGGVGIGGSLFVGDSSRFTSSNIAISSGTGALTVTGGVGIGGSLYVANTSRFESSVISSSVGTGALVVSGGVGIGGSLFVGNSSRFSSTNISSSSGTGALTVTGGVGIGGSLYVADASRFELNINSTTPGVGGLVATGGVGIGLSVSIGGRLQMFNGANFTAFVSSASGNTVYTLPATSPATGSSVLQSTSTGVMSWVPMTAGGGPSGTINSSTANNIAYYSAATTLSGDNVAGNYFQYTGDSRGLVIANEDAEFFTTSGSTKLLTVGTGATNYGTNRKALAVISTNNPWTNGDLLILGVGALGSDVRFGVDWTGRVQIGTPGTGFTLPVTNGTSGQVLTANTNGLASWTTVTGSSGAGSGTVAIPNAQFGVAYYAGTGASVSGTSLMQVLTSGTAISVFTNFDLRAQNDIRFFNADNSRFAALQASNVATNYTLSLPTAPVGNGYSTILVDTSGNMYFAPLEGGLASTSATGNRVVLRNKMEHHVWMAAGYTPLAAGADSVIYLIPDSSEDGASKITFQLKEFTIRAETPSAGTSRIQLELSSTDTGAFTLAATGSSLIGGSGLTLSGAGIYVTTTNTFVAGTFVTSGNLLRLNFNLLNATHANFSVQFTLNEV